MFLFCFRPTRRLRPAASGQQPAVGRVHASRAMAICLSISTCTGPNPPIFFTCAPQNAFHHDDSLKTRSLRWPASVFACPAFSNFKFLKPPLLTLSLHGIRFHLVRLPWLHLRSISEHLATCRAGFLPALCFPADRTGCTCRPAAFHPSCRRRVYDCGPLSRCAASTCCAGTSTTTECSTAFAARNSRDQRPAQDSDHRRTARAAAPGQASCAERGHRSRLQVCSDKMHGRLGFDCQVRD